MIVKKDSNFDNFIIKLVDYGLALDLKGESDFVKNCGTKGYIAPETF